MNEVNVLFPLQSGTAEETMYSIGNELKKISQGKINPIFLWITKMFRKHSKEKYIGEDCVEDIVKKYSLDPAYIDAYYRALRYDNIDIGNVARINMVETPQVSLDNLFNQSIIYLHASKNYLIDKKIDCIIFITARGLFQRSIGIMAREMKISTLYLCDALIPGDALHIWDCENNASDDLRNIRLNEQTDSEKKELDEFIKSQKQTKLISESPYEKGSIYKKVKPFFRIVYSNQFIDSGLYGAKGPCGLATDELLKKISPYFAKRFYDRTPVDEIGKYILLPYQIYYDLLLPLMWPEYSNIEYLTDICAKALPEGYKLVVKEHPHFKGGTPLSELKRISKKKNVVLVPVETNIQDLIKHSSAVIVVCSNVGWQALMYYKPVIVLNSTYNKEFRFYYDDYGITFNVKDLSDLPHTLKKSLGTKLDTNKIDSFLYNVIMKQRKGSKILCPVDYNKIGEDGNYRIVAEFLLKELQKRDFV